MLTSDNKSFQLTASYLLDLAQRAEQLFKESDEALQNKLLEYVLSNIELKDKKLSYMFNEPFRTIIETKKKSLTGSKSNIWCGWGDSNPWPHPWQGCALNNWATPASEKQPKLLLCLKDLVNRGDYTDCAEFLQVSRRRAPWISSRTFVIRHNWGKMVELARWPRS